MLLPPCLACTHWRRHAHRRLSVDLHLIPFDVTVGLKQVATVIWRRPHRICGRIGTSVYNTMFLQSPGVSAPSRTSIRSAVFAQRSRVTNSMRRKTSVRVIHSKHHTSHGIKFLTTLPNAHTPREMTVGLSD